MPYAIKDWTSGHSTLVEVGELYLRRVEDRQESPDWPRQFYLTRISAPSAHKWVKDGRHHETALYVDYGRIRKASKGE